MFPARRAFSRLPEYFPSRNGTLFIHHKPRMRDEIDGNTRRARKEKDLITVGFKKPFTLKTCIHLWVIAVQHLEYVEQNDYHKRNDVGYDDRSCVGQKPVHQPVDAIERKEYQSSPREVFHAFRHVRFVQLRHQCRRPCQRTRESEYRSEVKHTEKYSTEALRPPCPNAKFRSAEREGFEPSEPFRGSTH